MSLRYPFAASVVLAFALSACSSAVTPVKHQPSASGEETSATSQVVATIRDLILAHYAADFQSAQGDKELWAQMVRTMIGGGVLENLEADVSQSRVAVEGERAEVTGVLLDGMIGRLDMEFTLVFRDGRWLVVGQSEEILPR